MLNANLEANGASGSVKQLLSDIVSRYAEEATNSADLLEDGLYISNHVLHPKGERERAIEIKDGIVIVEDCRFSQSNFFEVNVIVKKIIS